MQPTTTNRRPLPSQPTGHRAPCLCGQPHAYQACFFLNPAIRPQGWVTPRHKIALFNEKLDADAQLRETVLAIGYEHYPGLGQEARESVARRNTTQQGRVRPHPKAGEGAAKELLDLPVELLMEVAERVYAMTVDELPATHPLIHADPQGRDDTHLTPTPRRVPAVTVLRNRRPPADLTRPKDRKRWLYRNPGQWGPIFQVMFVSKLFYEIGKEIRYRQVHIAATMPGAHANLLLHRWAQATAFLRHTKEVNLQINLGSLPKETIGRILDALKALPALKHLCLSLGGPAAVTGAGEDRCLLFFRELSLETLSIIWGWRGETRWMDRAGDSHDEEFAPVRSVAEVTMQEERSAWIRGVYEKSAWYGGSDDSKPIVPGKTRHIHDWTATRGSRGVLQWDVDCFIFRQHASPCPAWNLWKNPQNHPDQLRKGERSTDEPVREWRKGFEPYEDVLGDMERQFLDDEE